MRYYVIPPTMQIFARPALRVSPIPFSPSPILSLNNTHSCDTPCFKTYSTVITNSHVSVCLCCKLPPASANDPPEYLSFFDLWNSYDTASIMSVNVPTDVKQKEKVIVPRIMR